MSCHPLDTKSHLGGSPYKTSQNNSDYLGMAPVTYLMGKNVMGSYDGIYQPYHRPDLKERAEILGINTSSQYYSNINKKYRTGPHDDKGDQKLNREYKLLQGKFFVPQGTPLPLKHEEIYQTLPKDSMFLFAKNKSSPLCCPATYSSDQGCVCVTPQQVAYVAKYRGGNKTHHDNYY